MSPFVHLLHLLCAHHMNDLMSIDLVYLSQKGRGRVTAGGGLP